MSQRVHQFVSFDFLIGNAQRQFADQRLTHQRDLHARKQVHRKAVAVRNERVGQFDRNGVLDILHIVGVIEGIVVIIDIKQWVGHHF